MMYYFVNLLMLILPHSRFFLFKRWLLRVAGCSIGDNVRIQHIRLLGAHLTIGDNSFIGTETMIFGRLQKKAIFGKYVGKYWNILLIIIVALSIIYNFNKVEMFNITYGNWALFLSGSISAILLISHFCGRIICCNNFWCIVKDYGRFSLLVFVTHNYCLFVPITMINRLLPSYSLWQDYTYWIFSFIICLMLVLPISKIINNKAKWLIGK